MTIAARLARLALALILSSGLAAGSARATSWDDDYFTNLTLVTHEGDEVRLYDDLIRDKIVVFTFSYTLCPDICGLSTARLAQMVDWLGDRIGRDIFVYSITLDPGTDTPERLAEYRKAFGAPDGWVFLTGTQAEIDIVRHKLGERSRSLNEHRSDMVIGNGSTGQWRRMSVMGNLVTATEAVLSLDPSWRRPEPGPRSGTTTDDRRYTISDTRGEGLFITACAACHSIGEGVRVGPDLAGVTLRRDPAWLQSFIRAPDRMLAAGDPTATALDAAFPAVRMPNLGIGELDAQDLIHYLARQAEDLGQSPVETAEQAGDDGHGHAHDHGDHAH